MPVHGIIGKKLGTGDSGLPRGWALGRGYGDSGRPLHRHADQDRADRRLRRRPARLRRGEAAEQAQNRASQEGGRTFPRAARVRGGRRGRGGAGTADRRFAVRVRRARGRHQPLQGARLPRGSQAIHTTSRADQRRTGNQTVIALRDPSEPAARRGRSSRGCEWPDTWATAA